MLYILCILNISLSPALLFKMNCASDGPVSLEHTHCLHNVSSVTDGACFNTQQLRKKIISSNNVLNTVKSCITDLDKAPITEFVLLLTADPELENIVNYGLDFNDLKLSPFFSSFFNKKLSLITHL